MWKFKTLSWFTNYDWLSWTLENILYILQNFINTRRIFIILYDMNNCYFKITVIHSWINVLLLKILKSRKILKLSYHHFSICFEGIFSCYNKDNKFMGIHLNTAESPAKIKLSLSKYFEKFSFKMIKVCFVNCAQIPQILYRKCLVNFEIYLHCFI